MTTGNQKMNLNFRNYFMDSCITIKLEIHESNTHFIKA